MFDRGHLMGFVAGVAAVFVYHKFVKPLPAGKGQR